MAPATQSAGQQAAQGTPLATIGGLGRLVRLAGLGLAIIGGVRLTPPPLVCSASSRALRAFRALVLNKLELKTDQIRLD